ncbi:DUF1353 domain-containing protein [Campylobacter sp. RM16190]|uniref:DUF1353 domain-containing protein n=1 Tax=Campylobacter sp. RM16190 TaxID=1705727 RepID=UPI00147598F2|nr:DUF1353 domain-containing protein [Campylobacter sp. RM16190]
MKVTPTMDNRYELAEDFEMLGIKIPKGYKTNGANIPRLFYIIYPPFIPKYLKAIILHDYLCDLADQTIPNTKFKDCKEGFRFADTSLKNALAMCGASYFTRNVFYISVRAYHLLKYGA